MSGLIGPGLSALAGLIGWATGRQQAERDKIVRKSGQDEVKVAVAEDALARQDAARKEKEKADEEVRDTPYADRVDKL